MAYSYIGIIFNPNSTGDGEKLAKRLRKQVLAKLPKQKIELLPTDHAGHAEELAYSIAKKYKRPLIISSSGDGGYHEVINGALQAKAKGATPVTGVLPAGNANDHYRTQKNDKQSLIETIVSGWYEPIDVLKLTAKSDGEKIERFGHSYIGFGLTPAVGQALNDNDLNAFNQIIIVIKALFNFRSARLTIDGQTRSYDSVVFSNIASMSKVLKLSDTSSTTDGQFEMTVYTKRNKLQLVALLLKSTVFAKTATRHKRFGFKTARRTPAQIDGELLTIDIGSTVKITSEHLALDSIR